MPAGPAYCLEMTHDYRMEARSKDPHQKHNKQSSALVTFAHTRCAVNLKMSTTTHKDQKDDRCSAAGSLICFALSFRLIEGDLDWIIPQKKKKKSRNPLGSD